MKKFPEVRKLPEIERKRILVGTGFLSIGFGRFYMTKYVLNKYSAYGATVFQDLDGHTERAIETNWKT